MKEERTEIEDIVVDGYPMKKRTVYYELENGVKEIISEMVYQEVEEKEPQLPSAERAIYDLQADTAYITCLLESK